MKQENYQFMEDNHDYDFPSSLESQNIKVDLNNKLIYNKDPQIVGGHCLLHVRDFQNANYRILCQDHGQALTGVVNIVP